MRDAASEMMMHKIVSKYQQASSMWQLIPQRRLYSNFSASTGDKFHLKVGVMRYIFQQNMQQLFATIVLWKESFTPSPVG